VFRGRVVGTVLGDGVSVAVRGIDRITVAGLVVFGVAAVADVLYLGVRERASEFAALQAMGWADTDVARLVSLEGLAIGIAGGGAGATAGLVAIAVFVGGLTPGLIGVAAGSAAAGVLLATAAGVLPALILRRMPASQLAEQ
jgi:putative ABC transport system permease protein